MIGNPNRPNGGILQRFTGLYVPILDVSFDGATRTDSPVVDGRYLYPPRTSPASTTVGPIPDLSVESAGRPQRRPASCSCTVTISSGIRRIRCRTTVSVPRAAW
jgi:hypothetical protein